MTKFGFTFDTQAFDEEQFEKKVESVENVIWEMCGNDRDEVVRVIRRLHTKFTEIVVAIDEANGIEPSFQPKFVK